MSEERLLIADEDEDGVRLDRFLASELPELSRTHLQKLIADGFVLVADKKAKNSLRLSGGEEIRLTIPDPVDTEILPENIPLDILYEDTDVLIVNKPKNMVVHPSAGHMSGTLVNAILYHCRNEVSGKNNLSGINGIMRPGIVHRIDKDTTGALIVCKNDSAHKCIAEQLKVHSITRKYVGIVIGNLKTEEGTITGNIGRDPHDRKKMTVLDEGGKIAVTHYRVLEHFNGFTFCEFCLETGRTHQIRVHMASIGHPLLGDAVYGPQKNQFHLDGQTLHAMVIGFQHPSRNLRMEFTAPIPEYFQNLLVKLRNIQ